MKDAASRSGNESRNNADQVSSNATVGYASVPQFSSVAQRAAEKHIAVTVNKQEKKHWCWASVCETFTGKSQVTLANTYTPGYKVNGPGKYEDPADVLRLEGWNVDVTPTKRPDWGEMVSTIDGGETPVCMVGKHFVIICGYKGNDGNVGDRRYFYKDPADGDKEQECTEDELSGMNGGCLGWYLVFK
jgi:hypothetical protein